MHSVGLLGVLGVRDGVTKGGLWGMGVQLDPGVFPGGGRKWGRDVVLVLVLGTREVLTGGAE